MTVKWKYDDQRIAYADGTGTYEQGYYFGDRSTVECGGSPDGGPYDTREKAIEERDKFDNFADYEVAAIL